ncbi:carbonic anhydrase [Deinococcus sp. HMF7604]|uniref:carbonic anhydrase n=1 Tax=Deinococcus betulae TaxID=2873312 RepID=UPI001CCD78DB|nr:carbonic anhydrase [Deinococcus betulae]MBZ9751541.1 carbonic anhydrase [Deinococcus betulae]
MKEKATLQPVRRRFIQRAVQTLAGVTLFGLKPAVLAQATAPGSNLARSPITDPDAALRELTLGNLRFQQGQMTHPDNTLERRTLVAAKQQPYAIIFACSDSREAPELIFDEGLGDLFVIRTAGHVLDGAALGSLEFGVAELGIPLLVVLGHERCGAVTATMDVVERRALAPGNIETLVAAIRPAVLYGKGEGAARVDQVVRANTALTIQRLQRSAILAEAVERGKLKIVGGHYDLDTGAVSFGVTLPE